jgi:cytochrome b subunit of formate dehydrogenase
MELDYRKIGAIGCVLLLFLPVWLLSQDIDCMDCHDPLAKSDVHYDLDCGDCHSDIVDEDHEAGDAGPVNCLTCHDDIGSTVENDIHHRLGKSKVSNFPTCKSCHGTHDIVPLSRISNRVKTFCGDCHNDGRINVMYSYHVVKIPDSECLDCHEGEDVDYAMAVSQSQHEALLCAECHSYVAANLEAHQDGLESALQKADCYLCHADVNDIHASSIHGIALLEGKEEAAKCWDCHGSHSIRAGDEPESMVHPRNIAKTCGTCHDNDDIVKTYSMTIKTPGAKYEKSIHAEIQENGLPASTCVDCHGGHDVMNRMVPASRIHQLNIPTTCGQCHEQSMAEYNKSIHWIRAKKGVRMAPLCNDCHYSHSVNTVRSDQKRAYAEFQQNTCIQCHQNPRVSKHSSGSGDEAVNYLDSYHGLATYTGDENAAYCVDCHESHKIMSKDQPESSIHPDNVVQTCAKCHEKATVRFSQSYSHVTINEEARWVEGLVDTVYFWFVVIVLLGMGLHNLLIFFRDVKLKRQTNRAEMGFPRFSGNEKWQHILLFISFGLLAITGFALKYPDAFWVSWLHDIGMSETIRKNLHRASAVVMIILSFYHVAYLIISRRGRFQLKAIFPTYKDVRDALQNVAFYLGLRKEAPAFAYYDYTEKAEYWALIWGTIVMAVTGLILWFPTMFGDNAPVWMVKVAETIHFYEAILATAAIIIWHWFFVMFRPGEYPMNFTWLDGDTPLRHFRHHHKHDYDLAMDDLRGLQSGKKQESDIGYVAELILGKLRDSNEDLDTFLEREAQTSH